MYWGLGDDDDIVIGGRVGGIDDDLGVQSCSYLRGIIDLMTCLDDKT